MFYLFSKLFRIGQSKIKPTIVIKVKKNRVIEINKKKCTIISINDDFFYLTISLSAVDIKKQPLEVVAYLLQHKRLRELQEDDVLQINKQLFFVKDLQVSALKDRGSKYCNEK